MSAKATEQKLIARGYETHGYARGRSGACYLLASKRNTRDYGDKDGRDFVAVPVASQSDPWIEFRFSVSGTAFACAWVQELTGNREQYLTEAGVHRLRKFLQEDDTPGRKADCTLTTHSSRSEYAIDHSGYLRVEVPRVRRELLELLWENKHRGIKRTPKETAEQLVCTSATILDSVLRSLQERTLIDGAYSTSGLKITTEGETDVEKLRGEQAVLSSSAGASPAGTPRAASVAEFDLFISHASEDKEDFARPLAHALVNAGLTVWYDEFSLKVGDSLREWAAAGSVDTHLS